ncbi:hypothetical protein BU25DRAFT_456132 [Macroventuria anomochaeta]|uniref:Uncharacterized protein n=1 Tax=Macroventuria anomochaeta TaxID=301207 RepID=A0ACB6S8L5_9PLEO|nr:uncharacterized protein BU25DRAFT_456132 [Macroventuria anomochaeta]KAF2630393.1 hypothetical protein BU25DRAFT_456132 [Macroventuria anomochaeta]
MDRLAPPLHFRNFIYRSVLHANPGDGARSCPRATPAELAALLSSDGLEPSKDKPPHFYSAQLIHYGLLVTSDIDLAKHRLRNALHRSELAVPPEIREIEDKMSAL